MSFAQVNLCKMKKNSVNNKIIPRGKICQYFRVDLCRMKFQTSGSLDACFIGSAQRPLQRATRVSRASATTTSLGNKPQCLLSFLWILKARCQRLPKTLSALNETHLPSTPLQPSLSESSEAHRFLSRSWKMKR